MTLLLPARCRRAARFRCRMLGLIAGLAWPFLAMASDPGQDIDASFQRYMSLLTRADDEAVRTITAQSQGRWQMLENLDRLYAMQSALAGMALPRNPATTAEPPTLGRIAAARLRRAHCSVTAVTLDDTARHAKATYRCAVPDLEVLYPAYRKATDNGATPGEPDQIASIFVKHAQLLGDGAPRMIDGVIDFQLHNGHWLTPEAIAIEQALFDAVMPYTRWQQRMVEEDAPRVTGSIACDWPLYEYRRCTAKRRPQALAQVEQTEKMVQELVRDLNEQQTLDYCNNEVHRLVHAETGGFQCF